MKHEIDDDDSEDDNDDDESTPERVVEHLSITHHDDSDTEVEVRHQTVQLTFLQNNVKWSSW